jgi:BatD DUF11 like domain
MVKKIGNSIALMLWSFIVCADNSVSMRILDSNGDPIMHAVERIPFVLEVMVSSQDGSAQTPEIKGLHQFSVEDKTHVSTINSIINGEHSTKKIFRFVLRADKQGRYSIGPAYTLIDKQRVQSNVLTLVVGSAELIESDKAAMRLLVDKDRVLIGEKISCSLRFYPGSSASLDGITEPSFMGFSAGKLDGPFTGTEVIDGVNRTYVEWRTFLYPEQTGLLTIPAVVAVCKMQRKRRSTFDMFDRLFAGGFEQKQIFSNAVTINVDPLPPHKGQVNGIGTFTSFSAEREPAMAQEGEGIVVRLLLEGDGNFDAVLPIELSLPETLKYYESKHYMDERKQVHEGGQRKIFEYIVQGIKPGSWIIPQQTFTFFDVHDHTYKHLKSNELEVTIMPLANKAPYQPAPPESEKNMEHDPRILLQYDGQWRAEPERKIPWNLFLLFLCTPFLLIGVWFARIFVRRYYQKNALYISSKRALAIAHSGLKKAQGHQDVSKIYDIVIEFIAHRLMVTPTHVTSEYIVEVLKKGGWSPAMVSRWHLFFNELLRNKFGSIEYDEIRMMALYDSAICWLEELQKIL